MSKQREITHINDDLAALGVQLADAGFTGIRHRSGVYAGNQAKKWAIDTSTPAGGVFAIFVGLVEMGIETPDFETAYQAIMLATEIHNQMKKTGPEQKQNGGPHDSVN